MVDVPYRHYPVHLHCKQPGFGWCAAKSSGPRRFAEFAAPRDRHEERVAARSAIGVFLQDLLEDSAISS